MTKKEVFFCHYDKKNMKEKEEEEGLPRIIYSKMSKNCKNQTMLSLCNCLKYKKKNIYRLLNVEHQCKNLYVKKIFIGIFIEQITFFKNELISSSRKVNWEKIEEFLKEIHTKISQGIEEGKIIDECFFVKVLENNWLSKL